MTVADEYTLEFGWIPPQGNTTKGTITVRLGDDEFTDRFDVTNASHRGKLVDTLCNRWPALDTDEHRADLARELDRLASEEVARRSGPSRTTAATEGDEIEASRIVRPERFITPEVSGLTVPRITTAGDKAAGCYTSYLRWANGERQRVDLANTLDVPGASRLWIHPLPAAPTPSEARALCGWARDDRKRWLDTSDSPDPAELFRGLCERIAHFVELSSQHGPGIIATLSLWTILTYCYQAWDAVPYLYVGGPVHSGKSRVFEILVRLVFRPLMSSNMTGPTLFRTLHDRGGTLLLDEAERLKQTQSPEIGEITSMLLAGYKRGGQATRLEPVGDTFKTVSFDVYGPKAMACIRGLPPALFSRCIPVMMFRACKGSPKPRRRIDANPHVWQRLRDDLHAMTLNEGQTWLDLADQSSVCPSMHGRDYELWQPLMALAQWIESRGAVGLLKLVQSHALAMIDESKDDQTPEHDEALLRILTDEIRVGHTPRAGEILAKVREAESEMFVKWTARGVSSHLKRYGLATNKSRGRKVYGMVTLDVLRRIQDAYSLDLGFEEESEDPIKQGDVPHVPHVHAASAECAA